MNHYYSPSKQNTRGFTMYHGKNKQAEPGRGRQDPCHAVQGKTVNYNHDGSGRDTYIADINGGFYPKKQIAEYTANFKDQLRISHFWKREGTADYMARRN